VSRGESTRAIAVAHASGVAVTVHEYEPSSGEAAPGSHRQPAWGAHAAAALGVDPRRVFKTLVAAVDTGRLVLGIVPVAGELDLRALAAAAGGRRASMATAAEAERATGYVLGGISPLGLRRPLPAVIDATARDWPTIHVSAGRRGLQLEIDPADLVRLTGAVVAPIAREP
jgi:Cys-tRNA(Pro)/Cys-tRNA(Cys) deacylase